MSYNKNHHSFHVPVMGVAFTIDSPLKLAHLGISSVISMVDDSLLEELRKHYCEKFNHAYEEISAKAEDFRARRITSYLNLMKDLADEQFARLKESAYEKGSELEKYFDLLPPFSELKEEFMKRFQVNGLTHDLREWLHQNLQQGSIDINIMTKLDRETYAGDDKLPAEFNDAHAALRGFANSNLESSVVLSAGLNPKLYSYFEKFQDFYPNALGEMKKKIILKISDYRSALIQGKFFAKKGLWVSEFRMESGLNCGGHAFATEGVLMGPILQEFAEKREELKTTLFDMYAAALAEKGYTKPETAPEQKFTAQGGVGTAAEHRMLIETYKLDSVGWGTPFLLVPEATTVDETTMEQLRVAREKDLYLSHASPLGVRFNNLRNNNMSKERERLIEKDRPGSSCPKKYSVMNTEYTDKAICTSSRQYQHLKLKEIQESDMSAEEKEKKSFLVVQKECLCVGLTNSALMRNDMPLKHYKESVSICPGPNMAYFDKIVSLREMVGHIYGKNNIMTREDRPHMFLKELDLYIQFFDELVQEAGDTPDKQTANRLQSFAKNLESGIAYYQKFFENMPAQAEQLNYLSEVLQTKMPMALA